MIKIRRHQGLLENQRFFPFCEDKISNEHSIMDYVLQQHLFANMMEINNDFNTLDEYKKYCFLLSAPDATNPISKYLNNPADTEISH